MALLRPLPPTQSRFDNGVFPVEVWQEILLQVDDYTTLKKLVCTAKLFTGVLQYRRFDAVLFRLPPGPPPAPVEVDEEIDEDAVYAIAKARRKVHNNEQAMKKYTLHPLLANISGHIGRYLDNTGPLGFRVRSGDMMDTCLRNECAVWPPTANIELVMDGIYYEGSFYGSMPDVLQTIHDVLMLRLRTKMSVWTTGPHGLVGLRKMATRINRKNEEVLQLEPIWYDAVRNVTEQLAPLRI